MIKEKTKSIHELCLVDRNKALFYFLSLCHPEPQFIGEGQRTKNDILVFTEKNNFAVLEYIFCFDDWLRIREILKSVYTLPNRENS
ncbi:MAG: hypothetical protein KAS53_00650 [Candidatus Cloacimonetes bacterium]|nr:hypothetical protein [Candidatus Cloacimonadota bacterium]